RLAARLVARHVGLGHVDETVRIAGGQPDCDAKIHTCGIPRHLWRYVVEKGSLAVDGVSLTVVSSKPGQFTASLLAFTLRRTTLGRKGPGHRVNIEVDMLAKYVEQLVKR